MWPFKKKKSNPLFRVEEVTTNGFVQYYVQKYYSIGNLYHNIENPIKDKQKAIDKCKENELEYFKCLIKKRKIIYP